MLDKHADAEGLFKFRPKSMNDAILSLLAEQNIDILEEMTTIKKDFKVAFQEFTLIVQNCIKELKDDTVSNLNLLTDALVKLQTKMSEISSNEKPETVKQSNKEEKGSSASSPTKRPSKEKPKSSTKTSTTAPPTTSRKSPNTAFLKMPKVLYCADSVGHTVELNQLEVTTKSRIRSRKAYSSKKDAVAKWPESNFSDVVKKELAL